MTLEFICVIKCTQRLNFTLFKIIIIELHKIKRLSLSTRIYVCKLRTCIFCHASSLGFIQHNHIHISAVNFGMGMGECIISYYAGPN